ncbi:MAG: hemerythrin domain-containing protein [Brevundimonas sp.]|uniref:hemerythrin domain-containing protein n=1 Tax=Brevundimonas sp. TaxID=1871086 RepID=UPI002487E696|nr:hemerythrin domain-containing protein [Brevundimonas sp.]MDI1325360.1 hemerythrin domain-containing protein [Brevundimonas sp.]
MRLKNEALIWPVLLAALLGGCESEPTAQQQQRSEQERAATLQTPQSIAIEHGELHETLARAAGEGGEVGAAAGELERALAPHFKREEEIATPPLGLLLPLAQGDATPEMRSVLLMTDALERELPQMLREHDAIRMAVTKFRAAAERKGQQDYVRFADNLAAHARQEEEILYPAAILVGRHVAGTAPQR